MKKSVFGTLLFVVFLAFAPIFAQDSAFEKLTINFSLSQSVANAKSNTSFQIKDVQAIGGQSVVVFTDEAIYRSDDDGNIWRNLRLPLAASDLISGAFFTSQQDGFAIIYDQKAVSITIAQTNDGGANWHRSDAGLRSEDLALGYFDTVAISRDSAGDLRLEFRLPTSSNFDGVIAYQSFDNGRTWRFFDRVVKTKTSDEPDAKTSGLWTLKSDGYCAGFKAGCLQTTTVEYRGLDRTPTQISALTKKAKERAEAESPRFALPPGGATRTSLNFGFDKCTAGTVAQMQLWWNNSPLQDANIYLSGRNRGCAQPQLTASWVNQVSAMGWGLIPTVVGYQSPCTASTTTAKLSYDVATAETQGRGEADIAVADATNLGLTAGSILYYDMERYDETATTPGCRTATTAFLKGWTDRIKELGYVSGTYGSPKNAQEDWALLPAASKMDAIWMARWDNVPSVWTYVSFPTFPATEWANHQRIKQWQAPHNETWGGVTFNIDGNKADGPVAGAQIAKNKNADFDGDGKADISVFRPDSGTWFVIYSSNLTFNTVQFGADGDKLTPGDYNGDGKTDFAVFRPSNATWYILTKGEFRSRQFGDSQDIPVPGDYDGNGYTDIAVFRPSNGTWYIQSSDSLNTYIVREFGAAGDQPAPADYDGDGKTDFAVYRPSNGNWYTLGSSSDIFDTVQWGIAGDVPVQGDYDGDGKADIAIFRPSSGTWFVVESATTSYISRQFGTDGDVPAPADFDGDGKFDLGVYRPSNSNWYLLQSQNGFVVTQFGNATDKPVPNAYLPQ